MKKATPLAAIAVVSLVLNVILVVVLLLQPAEEEQIARLQKASFQSGRNGPHFLLEFTTPMEVESPDGSSAPPITFAPNLDCDVVWDTPKRALVYPRDEVIPGRMYAISPRRELRDRAGNGLANVVPLTACRPLDLEDVGAPERLATDRTRITFTFNGAVSPLELAKHLQVRDEDGNLLKTRPVETQAIRHPAVDVSHGEDCASLTVALEAGLRGEGGDQGLAAPYTHCFKLPNGLAVYDMGWDTDEGRIELRCALSGQLDLSLAGSFIETTPHVACQLDQTWGGRYTLRGDFQPRTFYRVIFRKGLRATDGRSLEQDAVRDVVTGDIDPVLSFITRGPYLPTSRRPELPVRLCNVNELELTATQIYPNNLVAFCRDGHYSELETGRVVGHANVLRATAENELQTISIPLGELIPQTTPGIYLITGMDSDRYWPRSMRTVVRTELGLSAALSDKQALVWVVGLTSNAPVPACHVEILSQRNQCLGTGTTDADGLARIDLDTTLLAEETPYLVTAALGEDQSFMELTSAFEHDLSAFSLPAHAYPRDAYEAFVYTERGISRPGEEITVNVLLRDAELRAAGGFPGELQVVGPDGTDFMTRHMTVDALGFASATLQIPMHARTGRYTARIGAPGAVGDAVWGSCTFQVGHYVPDRIKASMTLNASSLGPGDTIVADLQADYYFGTAASDCQVVFRGIIQPQPFAPQGFAAYVFGDAERPWDSPPVTRRAGKTDATGAAHVALDSPANLTPPAAAQFTIVGTVTEPGGRAVSVARAVPLHPYPYYLGLRRLQTEDGADDGTVAFEWKAVAPDGSTTSPEASLSWRLERTVWHYALKQAQDDNYAWQWHKERVPVSSDEFPIDPNQETGTFTVICPTAGNYALILTDRSGAVRTRLPFCQWEGSSDGGHATQTSALHITTDRERYHPGTSATIGFSTPASGSALVCVTTTQHDYTRVVPVRAGANTVTVDVPDTPFGSAYAAVTVLHKPGEADPLPRRLFGLVRLDIDQAPHRLDVALELPHESHPAASIPVTVRLADADKPVSGRVQLLAVDEGILALTGHTTPDPFGFFFGPRRCNADFRDMFDHLFPDVKTLSGMESVVGGGGTAGLRNPIHPKQLKPAIVVLQPVDVDDSGTVRLTLNLPDHSGAMKVMAVAFAEDAVGSAAETIRLHNPLTVQVTAPQAVAPGDEFEVTAIVFNHELPASDITVAAGCSGPVTQMARASESRTVETGKSERVRFRFRAQDAQTGPVTVMVAATSGAANDQAKAAFTVRPGTPPLYRAGYQVVKPGEDGKIDLARDWIAGTGSGSIRVATTPAVETLGALAWLDRYPYTCLEQTVSRAFPWLVQASDTPPGTDASRVQAAIRRIMLMELPGGGFSSWPGGERPWISGSIYAAHFLDTARTNGHSVEHAMWDRTLAFLHKIVSNRFDDTSATDRAYALYLLSQVGEPELGLSEAVAADRRLPGTARLLGAAAMIRGGRAKTGAQHLDGILGSDYSAAPCTWDMDSPTRRLALALVVLLDTVPESPELPRLLDALRKRRNDAGHWGSTQTNALVALGLGKWAQANANEIEAKGALLLPGSGQLTVSADQPEVNLENTPLGTYTVAARGTAPLYCSWSSSGVPIAPDTSPAQHGICVQRTYLDESGAPKTVFKQGDLVRVRLLLTAEGYRRHVSVADILPGCLEIEDGSLDTRYAADEAARHLSIDFVERLADRLLLFCDVHGERPASYTYTARVVSRGDFLVPAVSAQAMYEPDIHAWSGGDSRVTVQ